MRNTNTMFHECEPYQFMEMIKYQNIYVYANQMYMRNTPQVFSNIALTIDILLFFLDDKTTK